MDLKQFENLMNNSEGGFFEKKETLISNINNTNTNNFQNIKEIDSATALQLFLDHIPISSIPGIKSTSVVELKTGDSVRDAIRMLYEKNVFGALIADSATGGFSDRYIGFIDLSSIVLWCLEELEKVENHVKGIGDGETGKVGILALLDQNSHVGQTKIGELAKLFLWDPFFPIRLEDTLFHVLLLLSKHRLQVVPVVELSNSQVIGFISQDAVIQLLLQSSGLEWFDHIADKVLSEFRFENEEHVVHVTGDQNISEAFHILWESRNGSVAVIDQENKRLIGSLRNSDLYLLLEDEILFENRKKLTVKEFIHMEFKKPESDPITEQELGDPPSNGILSLRDCCLPRMDSPVTIKNTDSLKKAMKTMVEMNSSFGSLVDDSQKATGILTLRDMIIPFAPPCVDSNINGGGFFESALEQTGCQMKNGNLNCNH